MAARKTAAPKTLADFAEPVKPAELSDAELLAAAEAAEAAEAAAGAPAVDAADDEAPVKPIDTAGLGVFTGVINPADLVPEPEEVPVDTSAPKAAGGDVLVLVESTYLRTRVKGLTLTFRKGDVIATTDAEAERFDRIGAGRIVG